MSEWENCKKENYGKDICINYGNGIIDFLKESMNDVKNGQFSSYDEYLDVQQKSCGHVRRYFEMCYYGRFDCEFLGRIEKIDNGNVLFSRIMLDGLYDDGTGFYGKEDHVWMSNEDFKDFSCGECLRFAAEVYRYMKHGNGGKLIDYALISPRNIRRIDKYAVPTDEELVDQQIQQLVCETCIRHDHCNMGMCIRNQEEREERVKTLKSLQPGKFTSWTVLLAYELSYRMLLQSGGIKLDKKDPNYKVIKKLADICAARPVYYTGDVREAFQRMAMPDKPRIYIGEDV